MLAIQLSVIFPFVFLIVGAFVLGFFLRGRQLGKLRKRVIELEKEMLSNHAEILDLQKERASLLKQMKESKIPVIPMKPSRDDDKRHIN